jgi:hypothetical protein
MSRLLFTSSRDGVAEADVEAALRPMFAPGKTLVTGGSRGGDQIAERLWHQWGGPVDSHPVSPRAWQRSRGAGYARNAHMVAGVRASADGACLAVIARCTDFSCERREPHGTHGAGHCADLAEAAGLPVTRVRTGSPALESDIRGATRAEAAARRHGRYYPPVMALPEGICPGCRSSALITGRERCQSCGALEAMAAAQPRAIAYPDPSHCQPEHMCVLPGAGRDAEAGQ